MADIVGAKVKMNDIEVAVDAALSEALHTKIGANINALIDADTSHDASISSINSTLSTYAESIFQRGSASTTLSYSATEPFSEQLIGTLSIPVKGNTLANVLLDVILQLNRGKSGASAAYDLNPIGGSTLFETKFRVTRQIGAGSETDIINETIGGTYSAGIDSGEFLGAHRYMDGNHIVDSFSCTTNQTVVYRFYLDFNAIGAHIFTGTTFTGGGIDAVGYQVR